MRQVNFIPAARRERKRRARTLRVCATVCIGYAVLAAVAAAITWGLFSESDTTLPHRIELAQSNIKNAQTKLSRLRGEASSVRTKLRANTQLTDRPDWSHLMALVSSSAGEQTVLRRLHVHPAEPVAMTPASTAKKSAAKPGTAGADAPAFLTLELDGFARTSLEISRFALRLESLSLFDKVTVTDTAREPFQGDQATRFAIRCALQDVRGQVPAVSSTVGENR